ncbi:hypothetical protein N7468_005969 [Penicillium chermesinum]|uniref:Uncharacterized protein n=1 Tax=Penicillium chermesinum TaxID=63820 RepID=A0A9W9P0A5_9EURO|nr:uncharacterized protein N7468_005969 [Penicillium chermesinum]KAJ5233013.1 hypothetical protein N7468_005969 [Penicillium chermesinum]
MVIPLQSGSSAGSRDNRLGFKHLQTPSNTELFSCDLLFAGDRPGAEYPRLYGGRISCFPNVISPGDRYALYHMLCQGMVQASLAQSFLPNRVIGESFGAKSVDTAWYPAAYGMTSGAFMLASGRLGDIVGHKRLFVVAWIALIIWGLSSSLPVSAPCFAATCFHRLIEIQGLLLFNFAWNRAPETGWGDAQCIATLIIGLILILAFFAIEKRASQPIIPVTEIDRNALWVLLIEALGWSSFGILIFYSINFVIRVRGDTMLSAAAQLVPVPLTGLAATLLTAFLLNKGASAPMILAFSLLWFCVGNIILATMEVHHSYWLDIFWVWALSPLGMDMSFPAGTLLLSSLLPRDRQGIAASLIATVVYYSQSLGLGIAGVVEVMVAHGSEMKGYRGAWYLGIGLSGFGLIVSTAYAIYHAAAKRAT